MLYIITLFSPMWLFMSQNYVHLSHVKEMSEIMCNVCGQKCLYCQNFDKYSDHRTSYHLCPPEFARHMYTCQNIPAVKGILWEIGEKSKKENSKKENQDFFGRPHSPRATAAWWVEHVCR